MPDANFFRFFGFNGGGDVHKGFCCYCSIVFDSLDGKNRRLGVSLCGVDRVATADDKDWVGYVISQESVRGEIRALEVGTE